MAIKTMSASTGGGSKYSEGWHDAVISKAEYGEWNGKNFLEVWFEGYGEYQTINPDEIAKTYLDFYNQDKSAWSWEIELRTSVEKF